MTRPAPTLLAAVGATALASVYLEVSLMKAAGVMYTSLFVFVMIGVALLGYGSAGSLLAVAGAPSPEEAPARVARWLTAFAAVVVPAFLALNAIRVPTAMLFGSLRGFPVLLVIYGLLALPFLFTGLAAASAFGAYGAAANSLYFADLVGAGAGSALAIASIPWLGGAPLVAIAGVIAAAGALLAAQTAGRGRGLALAVGALDVALLVVLAAVRPVDVHIAPDKHGPIVARAANPAGLATDFSRWSTLGRVDVTEPFATLPPQFGGDVSPVFENLRIEQRMLLLDGAAPAFLYRRDGGTNDFSFLAGTSQSPAYRLRPEPRVLVIGVGGGTDVLIALEQGARHVTAVELNPVSAHVVRDVYADYLGNLLADPRVELVVSEGRNFVARSRDRYDIIQLSGVDTGAAMGAYGLGTMPESYIYTVEALEDFLAHLAPDGVLSITRDLQFDWALRLAAVARAALMRAGLEPESRIAILSGKGYGWATLLVKREPFAPAEVDALRAFASTYRFPLVYDPLAAGESSFDRVVREGATREGDFDLRPSTDDWPFFFVDVFWTRVLRGRGIFAALLVLPANLAALALLAIVLIGWPLRRLGGWRSTAGKGTAIAYFAALGIGFMLVEVALMQRFTIFLGDPMLAVATVLAALLVASGVGSWIARQRPGAVSPAIVAIVGLLVVLASPALPALLRSLLWMPFGARLALCVLVVALVGLPMGVPFPAGLTRLSARAPAFVPWAWGVNGMTSVVASLGSYLLGMVAGYAVMFWAAAALYAGALGCSRRL